MFYFQLKKKKKKKRDQDFSIIYGRSGKGNQTSFFFLGLITPPYFQLQRPHFNFLEKKNLAFSRPILAKF